MAHTTLQSVTISGKAVWFFYSLPWVHNIQTCSKLHLRQRVNVLLKFKRVHEIERSRNETVVY